MNISQKEKEAVRSGNVKALEEILEKELEGTTDLLINSAKDSGHDNRLKGKCLFIKEVLSILKG